jgi:hypothetical protein
MAPSEFFSSLRAANQAQRGIGIPQASLCLTLNSPTEVALEVEGKPYGLPADLPGLCSLSGVPGAYADALLKRGDTALLIANIQQGLRGHEGVLRFLLCEEAGERRAFMTRPTGLLLDRVEVFSAVEQASARYGFEPLQLLSSALGGSALYVRPAGARVVEGIGTIKPAIRVRYTLLAAGSGLPTIAHGFVLDGHDRFLGTNLVGVRKFKYLRDATTAHALVEASVTSQQAGLASEHLVSLLDASFAVDMMASHKRELDGAAARGYACQDTALLSSLMGSEYDEDYLTGATELRATRTQLALAFIACDADFQLSQPPYAILLKSTEQWDKLVDRFDAAPAQAAAAS